MGFNGTDGVNGTQGIQGPRGFNGTNGVNGTQGPPGPTQIPPSKIYTNSSIITQTLPQNSPRGVSLSFASCLPGDTAISGGAVIIPLEQNFFPGIGTPLSGSYLSGIESSRADDDTWSIVAYGNNLEVSANVVCFDN